MEGGERRQQETAERRERGMVGGEEAAGETLDAGSEAWREESRQRVNRWTLWG